MREKKEINVLMGEEIRKAREAAGLKKMQEKFGELVDLGPKNVSDIERGVTGITVSTLKRICQTLPVSPDTILFGNQVSDTVDELADRLRHLSPEELKLVKDFLNTVFEMFAVLRKK